MPLDAKQVDWLNRTTGVQVPLPGGPPLGSGAPLDPKKTYRLATNDYMARGGDGYDMLKQSKAASDSDEGRPLTQVVIDYLGSVSNLSLRPDGRIRQVE